MNNTTKSRYQWDIAAANIDGSLPLLGYRNGFQYLHRQEIKILLLISKRINPIHSDLIFGISVAQQHSCYLCSWDVTATAGPRDQRQGPIAQPQHQMTTQVAATAGNK